VFNVTLADVPAPPAGATVAIKVIDMLGEERVISLIAPE